MEEAAAVRRAALDAVEDVEPAPLRDAIQHRLSTGSMAPGVLSVLAVRALGDGSPSLDDGERPLADPVANRAAGVQLIYDGLRLTRQLAHDQPWVTDVATNGHEPVDPVAAIDAGDATEDADAADLAILAADVLVARGFYLLARTEAAEDAVAVVRAFGRDQTVRRQTDDPSLDRNLEADVLELAVVAGATLAGTAKSPRLREYAASLAAEPFPAAETFCDGVDLDALAALATDSSAEGVTTVGDQ
ncbi:hypothetical protein ACKVMT_11505 [Halobacteriales archaeon Cl-PHB]